MNIGRFLGGVGLFFAIILAILSLAVANWSYNDWNAGNGLLACLDDFSKNKLSETFENFRINSYDKLGVIQWQLYGQKWLRSAVGLQSVLLEPRLVVSSKATKPELATSSDELIAKRAICKHELANKANNEFNITGITSCQFEKQVVFNYQGLAGQAESAKIDVDLGILELQGKVSTNFKKL